MSVGDEVRQRGVSRRDFLKFCATMAAALAMPRPISERIALALDAPKRTPIIWLKFQDCAGCTESLLRASRPTVSEIVLDILSVDYHETIMAAAGYHAEAAKKATNDAGGYILIVEGSITKAEEGVYCTNGRRTALDLLEEAAANALAVIAVGHCASFGCVPRAKPNPTDAVGVLDLVKDKPVLNLPGCPYNVVNLTVSVVHFLTFGELPAMDQLHRPLFAFGARIHDNCERRGHFDASEFVKAWGDEGHQKGWCLYQMDCKGPLQWINRSIYLIAGAGIVLSALHQSSLGSMFLLMPYKLHPLWWTPALPELYLWQAIYTGLGMTAIAIYILWRALGIPLDRELFRRIGQAMGLVLLIYMAIKVGDLMGAQEVDLLLRPDVFGVLASPLDPNSQWAVNADVLAQIKGMFARAKEFVERVYLPDVLAVAPFYLEWAGIGSGVGNFLAYGDFDEADGSQFIPQGFILGKDLSKVHPLDHKNIAEYVNRSWYVYSDESQGLHPWEGETNPRYTGPKPPYEFLETDQKYTWMKAPRLEGHPMEVGPLARMLVAYASGHKQVQDTVNYVLSALGAGPEVLFSTLGRTAARCIETVIVAQKLAGWVDELIASMKSGDLKIHEGAAWDPAGWPSEAKGWGYTEAPRGALGHWIHIKDQKIHNYQAVVPSTWNCSPRDPTGQIGPYEAALIGTPIADPNMPLEVLRTIHSFDPCMACGVHLLDARGRTLQTTVLQSPNYFVSPLLPFSGSKNGAC
ncbi:MAG: hydrogenase small subunit [Chloroflexi bacterium]|nr:hydrogenase small subunit [Chloroflexota bacterium]